MRLPFGRQWATLAVLLGVTTVGRLEAASDSDDSHHPSQPISVGVVYSGETDESLKAVFDDELQRQASILKLAQHATVESDVDSFHVAKTLCQLGSAQNLFALFGFTSPSTWEAVDEFARTYQAPLVSVGPVVNDTLGHGRRPTDDAPTSFSVHLRPLVDAAIVDVIRHRKWQRVAYVYDTKEGLARLERLYNTIQSTRWSLTVEALRLTNVSSSYAELRQLDQRTATDSKYIVLDLSSNEAFRLVLRQVEAVGMNRANYHYLLGSLSINELDLSDFRHAGMTITGFSLLDTTSPGAQSAIGDRHRPTDGQRPTKLDAALAVDAVRLMSLAIMHSNQSTSGGDVHRTTQESGSCSSLRNPSPWQHGSEVIKRLKRVTFQGVTGNVSFDTHGYRRDYKLYVHEMTLDTDVRQIGTWDTRVGLDVFNDPKTLTSKDTFSTANKTLIVTTIETMPYLMRRWADDGDPPLEGNDRFEGFCADLARTIFKDILGLEYRLEPVKDNRYGSKVAEGTWNGMIGELTRREADVAVAPLTITSTRERVVNFSPSFMQLGISIMIKKPQKQQPGVFPFLDPLSHNIWLGIVFSYLAVSAVLFLVSRFGQTEKLASTAAKDFTILNSLWFSLAALFRQGCNLSPRSVSGRVVGSAWWLFTLFVVAIYTASLTAFFTIEGMPVERMLTPIESADDLVKQTEIQYGTLDSGSSKEFFRSSKIGVYERMWHFMSGTPDVFVRTIEDGVQRVRQSKGKYALLLDSTTNDFYNQRKPCNTMRVGGDLDSKGYGIATPIGSVLRERISMAVLELMEKGYLLKLYKKWWHDKSECVQEDVKRPSRGALTLPNVAGLFYILIGGLGLSLLAFLLEFGFNYCKGHALRKRDTTPVM